MKKYLLITSILLCANFAFAQSPAYRLVLKNDTLVSPTSLQFEIYLERSGSSALELAGLQPIMTFNTGIAVDSLTFSVVNGFSDLSPFQRPTNAKLSIFANELRIAAFPPPGAGSGSLIPLAPGARVGRFQLTSSTPFPHQRASIAWKSSGVDPITKLNAYVDGINTAITDTASHFNELADPVLSPITITTSSPLPSALAGVVYLQTLDATGGTIPYVWSIVSGSLPPGLSLSSAGIISGTTTVAGEYSFAAGVVDNIAASASKQFALDVIPGPAARLTFIQEPSNGNAGAFISPPVTVQLKDLFGNNVPSAGDTVTMALFSGTGILNGTKIRLTDAGGLATFNDLSVTLTGTKRLRATRFGITPDTSNSFSIVPGGSTTLVFVQNPTDAVSDEVITPAVSVRIRDSLGNDVHTPGIVIGMFMGTGTGVLSGTISQPTDTNGIARFPDLSIDLAGTKTLSAGGAGLIGVQSATFTISTGPAAQVSFNQEPTNTVAGVNISPQITVQVRDAAGNAVSGAGVSITASLIGSGHLGGQVNRNTGGGGQSVFNNLNIDSAGTKRLRVASGILAPDTSAFFTISPGPATRLAYIQQPTNGPAGSAITPPVVLQLRDAIGNDVPDAGDSIFIALSSGTGTLTGTTRQATNSSGNASFADLVINQGGLKTFTASGPGLTPLQSAGFTLTAYTVTATAGPNGTISPSGPVTVFPGADQSFTITPNTGYHVDSVIVDGVNVGPVAAHTFTNVTANHTIRTVYAVNQFTITATTGPNGAISPVGTVNANFGSNQTFTITPNTGYHIDSVIVDGTNVGPVPTYTFTNVTADHAIRSVFAINQFTITATTGPNGSIIPGGSVNANFGSDQTFTITPVNTYHIDSVIVDGANVGSVPSYTFTNITANHTIRAVFAIDQFTITATAGPNGAIAPPGATSFTYGSSQSYTVTPNTGYHIDSLIVDGTNQGALAGYSFTNIIANHTIRAVFAINQFTITSTSDASGDIIPDGVTIVNYGASQSYTIIPNTGFHIDSLFVDGLNQGPLASFTFTNVTANHTIRAEFAINAFTITATTGPNGALSPIGSVNANFGGTQAFTLTPNTGYHVDSVIVDGANAGSVPSYTFTNITANHTIRAVFAIDKFTITATAGPNGTIVPLGTSVLNYGSNQSYTITPSTGYHIDSVIIDGANQGALAAYTFTSVDANHTIRAVFAINQFIITSTAGAGGEISPVGPTTVNYGNSQSYTIIPNTGYHVDSVIVDGLSVGPVGAYTFNNVTANHTIRTVYAINQFTITATTGPNGSISPSGSVNAEFGGTQAFTLTPNTGYHVDSLIVDGTNQGSQTTYTFINITTNHTIRAVFAPNAILVTVQTVPAGMQIRVDDVLYTSPRSFSWTAAQSHSITVLDTIGGGAGRRFIWSSWSDSGAKSHLVTPLVNRTYTAAFTTQFFLTMSANTGGTVTPLSGWNDSASVVPIEAFPAARYDFSIWSGTGNGSYSFNANPATVTMNGPISEIASFVREQIRITVNSSPPGRAIVYDGNISTTQQTYTITPGTTHFLDVYDPIQSDGTPGKRFVWAAWSDGGARTHSVTPDNDTTFTAFFPTQFFLTMAAKSGGSVAPVSDWKDSALVVPITATPSPGYTFAGWNGVGNGSYTGIDNPAAVTMHAPIRDTASFTQFPVNVTIQSSPPGREIVIDGVHGIAPQSRIWTTLSSHTISTVDSQESGGTRYLYRAWSDGGAMTHTVAPNRDTTFTVFFNRQYFLTMGVDSGGTFSPPPDYKDSGSVVNITAIPASGFVFSNWTGSGTGSYSGASNPVSVTMGSPISETAHFTRFSTQVTIQTVPTGQTIVVDSVAYSAPHVFSWTTGSAHSVSTIAIQTVSAGTRQVWSSWSDSGAITHVVTPSGPTTLTANFTTQYFLTINANPGGTVSPASNWFNSGQVVPITATPDSTHYFNLWTGVGAFSYSGNANPANILMFGPATETANFIRRPVTIVIQSNPAGRPFTYDGVTYTDPQTRSVQPGEQHFLNVVSPQTGTPGTRYIFANWSDGGEQIHSIQPDSDATYTVNFTRQYYLTIVAGTGGTASPASDWYDSGAIVPISATPNFTYSFTGWRGSGNGSYTGPDNPATVTMNTPVFDTAAFTQNPVHVTIQTIPPGRRFTVDGIDDSTSQSYVWIAGSTHALAAPDTEYAGTGTRYIWQNWSDGGARIHNIAPTRDTTITVTFATQHYLTMIAGSGGTVNPQSGWRAAGAIVNINAQPNPTYTFGGWNGAGSIAYTGPINASSVTMNSPITQTASFVQTPVSVAFTTQPDGRHYIVDGTEYSKAEVFTWNSGASHTISVPTPQGGIEGVQYAWKSWSDGRALTHTINPTTDSAFAASFTTQFMLTMMSDSGGTVTPASGWQDSGKIVQLTAIPVNEFQFTGWNGTGPGEYTGMSNPVAIRIDGPITQVASFSRFNAEIIIATSPPSRRVIVDSIEYLTPHAFSWVTGSVHTIEVESTQTASGGLTRYLWNSWSDGRPRSHKITAQKDSTFTATFSTQYYLTMSVNIGGTTDPPSGWHNAGQVVDITGIPDSGFVFNRWVGIGNVAYDGFNNPATITMNGPISEQANFRYLPVHISLNTNPPGRLYLYNGEAYSSPQTFTVTRGTQHNLGAPDPQPIGAGMQYVWSSWSDSGAREHAIYPYTDVALTANFDLQYSLTVNVTPPLSGTTVPTGTTFWNAGDTVQLIAIPAPGYAFVSWSGAIISTDDTVNVILSSPKSVVANFASAALVNVTSVPTGRSVTVDGIDYIAPKSFSWIKGSPHTISTTATQTGTAGTQYAWSSWSDRGARTHTVATTTDTSFVANFITQHFLTITSSAGGHVTPSGGWVNEGTAVALRALPDSGYHLVEWQGTGNVSISGTQDTITVTMNGPISEYALFGVILPGPSLAGIPDKSTNVATSPLLSWMTYSGGTSYRLQVSADSFFASVVFDSTGIADTSCNVPILANLKKYHWRVNARVPNNITSYSGPRSFTTKNATIAVGSQEVNWGTGYTYPIKWNSTDLSGSVRILLMLNNGSSGKLVEDSLSGSGTYQWLVPDSASFVSTDCRVRVTSSLNSQIFAESNLFDIVAGTVPAMIDLPARSIQFPQDPYASTDYRLFSIPGIADTFKVGSFISGTQVKEWRMFADNGGAEDYLEELTLESPLATGTGYWLVQKGNLQIPGFAMAVPPLSPDATYSVAVTPGWNIIANPFSYKIPWNSVLESSGLPADDVIYGYEGGYDSTQVQLEPFKGYYYFCEGPVAKALKMHYPFGFALPSLETMQHHIPTAAAAGWKLQLAFSSDINHDEYNYIGVVPGSQQGLDATDSRKPPLFLDQGFLYFKRSEWDARYPRFNKDLRPSIGDGQEWKFDVSNPRMSGSVIEVRGLEDVPAGYKVVLINEDNSVPVDLRKHPSVTFQPARKVTAMKILVGTEEFIARETAKLLPSEFALAQNFPNPFNPVTSIGVKLPQESSIRLEVYSILGQRVKVLAEGQFAAGTHTFVWSGTDESGNVSSSGIYMYRLTANGKTLASKKMVLAK